MTNQFAVPFNQEAAMKAGGSDFISEGGAYPLTIISAKYIKAGSGSDGMEFEVKTEAGQTAKFINIYYKKSDGTIINSGYSTLCGIMYFLGLQGLSMQNAGENTIAPELTNAKVGMFLQKVLYTKKDQKDGFKFDLRAPFKPDTMHTVKEAQENKQPATIQNWLNSYQDKDDRTAPQAQGHSNSFDQQSGNDFGADW